tara:strand:+ start:3576 stop:5645 length:2070 start_codon:yes stop_codon:yes gene_type:complete
MRYYYIVLIILFSSNSFTYSQGGQQFGKIFKKSENQPPIANAGSDIKAAPGSTITISGEKSGDPNGDVLQFEWSLPPSLMAKENYTYDKTDTVKTHKGNNDGSIDMIKTFTETFLLDIPESLPIGSKHTINLTVKDKKGLSSTDSFEIELIKPKEEVIEEEVVENIEPEQQQAPKKKKADPGAVISIQSLAIGNLVPMQAEAINDFIYQLIRESGMKNVVEPNQYRPDTVYTIKQADSLNPALMSEYDTSCMTDSCAAQNAIMDKATHVLSWSLNKHNSLSFHFFDAREYIKQDPNYSWSIFTVPIDPNSIGKMKLPKALAIDVNGDLIVSSANTNSIYRIGLNQKIEEIASGKVYNEDLINPSGIDVGSDGKIYISDRDNNRVFSASNGKYKMLADRNSSVKMQKPTSLRALENGSVVVICEGDQSVRLISSNGRSSMILGAGIVEGMTDIAIDNVGNYYVVSPYLNQVFKIINKNKVEVIAGAKTGTGLRGNGIPANQAELYNPVAIDFDASGKMYIAEKGKGLIRYIEEDNLLYTIAGGGFTWDGDGYARSMDVKISNISNMRVGTGPSIYISQMLEHSIRSVSVTQEPSWLANDIFMNPMHLVHESGVSGLESHIRETVPKVLKGYLPKQKKSIRKRFKDFNRNIAEYFKERPLLFAVLLLFGSQATSSALGNAGSLDTPPDFPF